MTSGPWICPKCGKVYGPSVMECASCNYGIPTPIPIPPSPIYPYPYTGDPLPRGGTWCYFLGVQ